MKRCNGAEVKAEAEPVVVGEDESIGDAVEKV